MEIQNRNSVAMGVESVRKKRSRWESSSSSSSSSMGDMVESVRKKSSRWGSSSSSMGIMDEDIRNAMQVEIRRLTEEEEFDKNITNAMLEKEEVVLQKIRNLLWVESVDLSELMMGVTDEEIRKEGEKIQKKITKAMKEELDRLVSMRIRDKIPFVSMDEDIRNAMEAEIRSREVRTCRYLMEMGRAEQIRDMRSKFVLHMSPLEIIDNPGDQDFINVAADNNINQTELVIIVINHHSIRQYWTPRSDTDTSSSSCQHHDDYLHPRDDDDEEMILAACRPLLDSPRILEIILDQGVFATSDDDDDEQHIMSSTQLSSVDVLLKYSIIPTYEHLEDLKRNITLSISEAKPHVLRVKPKRVRICVQVSQVQKQYYGSAEDATFDANVDDAHEPSACHPLDYGDSDCAY